ncbi:MAG TPA: phage terminase large subunit [Chitinophagaceae bacterium]|mgnify:CR=1 FL=1|nr:phage terminase large subunit [Chitinophagaceae bacterium]
MSENTIDISPYVVPKVAEAVLSDAQISLIYGWRDGGKSTSAWNVLLWQCLLSSHFRWGHGRAKYNEIQGSTFQTLKDCAKEMGLSDYFLFIKDGFKVINKLRPDNFFFGVSADQPDKVRSVPRVNGILIDEAHDMKDTDFASLMGTLREDEKYIDRTKVVLIFNNDKVSQKSFLYTMFFDPKSLMYNEVERVLISYEDNPFINKEKTEKKLMMVAMNDRVKFLKLRAGEFLAEENKNPWFYALDANKHYGVKDIGWNRSEVLYLAFDFNISPMTCVVAQMVPGIYCRIIKSYKIKNCTSREFCKIIKKDFPGAVLRVTADPAGNARNANYESVSTTGHAILRQYLGIGLNQMDKPMLNFNRRDAHTELRTFCNTVLQEHPNFSINPNWCADLIADLEMATTEEGSDKLYKTSGDTEFGMHLTDCFIYLLTTYLNSYLKRQL